MPQKVTQNTKFIKVALTTGGEFYYSIPDAEGITFESGKKYQYKITVNQSGLTVTSEISDWTPVSAKTGDAVMD